jgi:DNA-binding transcriptional MerR regulator
MATSVEKLHQIGEVAERVGLSLRTVRYYEEMGLAVPSRRTDGGFRLYTDRDIERLAFIKQMKPLGFSVQEMRELLDARDRLAGGEGDEASVETLSAFVARSAEECERLRSQLDHAQQFCDQLRREVRRARRRSSS